MMILREPKLVFIKTKKTGGSSIEIALGKLVQRGDFVSPLEPGEEKLRKVGGGIVRASLKTLRERSEGRVRARNPHNGIQVVNDFLPDLASGCTSFCVERNPWDKAISAFYFWMHKRRTEIHDPLPQFTRFCRVSLRHFSDFHLYSAEGTIIVDRVLRYENLHAEFSEFLTSQGIEGISLGEVRAKSGIRRPERLEAFYGSGHDNQNVKKVAKIFAAEIQAFGYEFPSSG